MTSMMPGMGRVNPRQMKQAMRKMGISTEELNDVQEIIILTKSKEYVFKEAEVTIMTVQGQKTFQIVGEPEVKPRSANAKPGSTAPAESGLPEEDITLVMEQTGASREKAIEALKATDGQPAEAILKIMGG
ncbi:MAG: nascent polypeptide-associated complex protein [Methanomassiliicoccales archaeon]